MTASELFARLESLGVKLRLERGELRVKAPKGVLNAELKGAIEQHYHDLVALVRGDAPVAPAVPSEPAAPAATIPAAELGRAVPLSFAQERFFFLCELEGDTTAYALPFFVRLRGALDVAAFESSLDAIVRRHDSLRTTFEMGDADPVQVVREHAPLTLTIDDVTGAGDPAAEAVRRAERAMAEPFDLREGPLYRFVLYRLGNDDHILFMSFLHMITDGLSIGVLQDELTKLYEARVKGQTIELPPLPIQYTDFACWQRDTYADRSPKLLGYWKERLAGLPTLDLPTDRPRPARQTFGGTKHRFVVPEDVAAAVTALGRSNGWTQFMVLLGAFEVLLARYSGQDEVVVGTPIANRSEPQVEPLIGLFVNTLVLRTDVSGRPTFRDLMKRIQDTAYGAFEHQDMPFEQLVQELKPERDLSRNPLFQVMFNLLHAPPDPEFAGVRLEPVEVEESTSMFDLTLALGDTRVGLAGSFEYNVDLFDAETIERMEQHLVQLLGAIAADPDTSIFDLPMLTDEEREHLLVGVNRTQVAYPRERTLYQLFEEQVAERPDQVAVTCGAASLTYAELNARANRFAHLLRQRGVGRDQLIGVALPRGLDLLVALLGIQKSGAAYVPLDPGYPEDRIAFIVEDAGIQWMVRAEPGDGVITLAESERESSANPEPISGPSDLAYVIFTSGSTGKPKGVQIEHRALVNFLATMAVRPGMTADDVLCAVTTISFDIAGLELYLPLLVGGRIALATEQQASDGSALAELLRSHEVTLLQATPSTWRLLLEAGFEHRSLVALCGGEALPRELAEQLMPAVRQLWNMYGPTETTIWSLVQRMESGSGFVPIGSPIANTQVYVLDASHQPVPVGVPGVLYLGGDGLARGYWNRPELTAEKFVAHPFSDDPQARIYETGDLVRWRHDGSLEFLGRVDNQVKIRGFRIELGEIEHVLADHDAVAECAVVPMRSASGDLLAAHVVFADGRTASASDLREHLRGELPDYMIPGAFVTHDALPLTPNGKVDRKTLQASDAPRMGTGQRYLAPRTDSERLVAEVWGELLGVERVGRHDNFFELGGHSLLIMQVRRLLRDRTEQDLSVAELFEFPTVATLAAHLSGEDAEGPFAAVAARAAAQRAASGAGDIAIIGMAGRFPGARNLDEFWRNLEAGVESTSRFTDDELIAAGVPAALVRDPNYIKVRGVLDEIETFDADFFGIPAREAQALDPQQRLFLENAYQAIENAGYDPLRTPGSVGVWAGSAPNNYYHVNLATSAEFAAASDAFQMAITAYGGGFLATRVAYKLNLKGPAIEVQTACSTSLVAVAQACQSLRSHGCDMALAGGVALMVPHRVGYLYQEGLIFSPDGHCRPFDRRAQGTIGGEGVGAVVLKRLEDAVADGDPIRAVIRGAALNNDGSLKVGFTAPSVEGQAEVIAMALAQADVDPATISYVEAHGTGTPLGDPIEIGALTKAYRAHTDRTGYCGVGSVKSNFGHADAAAGVAGLLKTVLAMQHRTLPKSLHFEAHNPEIDFGRTPFYVNAETKPWPDGATPRRAGVSSFGFGGTNAHVIVEEAPAAAPGAVTDAPQLLVLSARSEHSLERAGLDLADWLDRSDADLTDVALPDVALTTQSSRGGLPLRRCVVARDAASAVAALRGEAPERAWAGELADEDPPVVFMFPGQGAQHVDMGRELYDHEPVFRAAVDECCGLLEPHVGLDLRTLLYPAGDPGAAADQLSQTRFTQPAIFVVEYALAQSWQAWGITPSTVVGHSVGEFVAACLAGVFSLDQALELVAARGRMMQDLPAGDMLSVGLAESEVAPHLSDEVSLAAINGPGSCVVSGPAAAVASVRARLEAADVPCRVLHTSHAFHSAMMEPIVEPFAQLVAGMDPQPAEISCVSTVTGGAIRPDDWAAPNYWARNLRQPVRFAAAAAELLDDGAAVLLEVGPGQTLSALARQQGARAAGRTIVASMRHVQDESSDREVLRGALGRLWIAGVTPDWEALHGEAPRRRVVLPAYPFDRQRYWVEPSDAPTTAKTTASLDRKNDFGRWFYAPSWRRAPLPTRDPATAGRWLVCDDGKFGNGLVQELNAASTVVVRAGESYRALGDREYELRPGSREDWEALAAALRDADRAPDHIVNLWGLADSISGEALFLGTAAAARAFSADGESVRLELVTRGLFDVVGGDATRSDRSLIVGAVRVIPQEYPGVGCRVVDVAADASALDWPSLLAEWATAPTESFVARRGTHRWVRSYEPVALPATEERGWRVDGTYVITGGLGGVGLALAQHLAAAGSARIALLGRSGLPERARWDAVLSGEGEDRDRRRVAAVRALEGRGAEVMVVPVDVADAAKLRVALSEVRARFGRIDGVIHAAGAIGQHLVEEIDEDMVRHVAGAKIAGTDALFAALTEEPPDFVLLCSSISCAIGGLGLADYVGANAYLDACVADRGAMSRTRVISVQWDTWSDVGFAVDMGRGLQLTDEQRAERQRVLDLGIRAEQGCAAFDAILRSDLDAVVVSTMDLPARVERARGRAVSSGKVAADTDGAPTAPRLESHARPKVSTEFVAPESELEIELAEVVQGLLGIDRVGSQDNLFELGFDSLIAHRMISRMKERFQTKFTLRTIMESPTVAALAKYVRAAQWVAASQKNS